MRSRSFARIPPSASRSKGEMMGNHPARNGCHSLVVALALLLAGCRSSSPGAPGRGGEGDDDGGGIDLVVGGGDAEDDAVEADSAVDDGSGGTDAESDAGGSVDRADAPSPSGREVCTAGCMVIGAVAACPVRLAPC